MKKALIIVSDFPPLAGTNTQRIQNFVRYLPDSGWGSIVVTQLIDDMELFDSKEMNFQPGGCEVFRVANPDVFARNRRSKGGYPVDVSVREHGSDSGLQYDVADNVKAPKPILSSFIKNVVSWFLKLIYCKMLYIPDSLSPWSKAACEKSLLLLKQNSIDILVTSIPAYSCHVAGLRIKKANPDLMWVVDFRDLWVDRPGRAELSSYRRRIESKMEKDVVTLADSILVASPAWKNRLKSKYGDAIASKVVVITNGFDSEKLQLLSSAKSEGHKITITNTGAMFSSETPVPFLQALGELCGTGKLKKEGVEVRLIGYAGDEIENIDNVVSTYELRNVVKLLGAMSHDECIVEQKTADILLLCNGMQHKETIRGKSFEYMATGKRILALTPVDGVQASILEKSGTAAIVDHDDIEGIKRELLAFVESVKKEEETKPNWEYINSFSRRNITKKFAMVLDSLLKQHSETK